MSLIEEDNPNWNYLAEDWFVLRPRTPSQAEGYKGLLIVIKRVAKPFAYSFL